MSMPDDEVVHYHDPQGMAISYEEYLRVKDDPEVWQDRIYINDTYKIVLTFLWKGERNDIGEYCLFQVRVSVKLNVDADGNSLDNALWVEEPGAGDLFLSKMQADIYYEHLLATKCGCEWVRSEVQNDSSGEYGFHILEKDNQYVPPTKNQPSTLSDDSECGMY